jgi:hypothetical protein
MGYFLALTLVVTSEAGSVRYFREQGHVVDVDRRTGRVMSLTIKGKDFTDKDLPRLAPFKRLVVVTFSDTGLKDMMDFPHLPNLFAVFIHKSPVTDFGIENLCTRNPTLVHLVLEDLAITTNCFAAIRRLPNLTRVHVQSGKLPDGSEDALAEYVDRMAKARERERKGPRKGP